MKYLDFVSTNREFQSSINIGYDFGSPEKIKSLIPTDVVCRYLEDILEPVMSPSHSRAKSLVAPYGSGKSHITLTAASSMWLKQPDLYEHIVKAYRDRGNEFADDYAAFVKDGAKLLPVIITGSSVDLKRSLLYSLRTSLRSADMEELMPKTNFDGALRTIARWRMEFPETLEKFEALTGYTESQFCLLLRNMDTSAYSEFVHVYPKLTAGSTFDTLEDANVVEVYDEVLAGLKVRGISGIYVIYDEFSKYLEANITSASVEDIKLLQDFAEKCTRSTQDMQLHLLLISHKTLANYIDAKLPKNKRDGWSGVSGRFEEVEIRNDANQAYELISHAIVKTEPGWSEWFAKNHSKFELLVSRYSSSKPTGLFEGVREDYLIYGCYPLHPITACLLPRLSSKVAQNERTLFTFLCSNDENCFTRALTEAAMFVSPDAIFDYFEPLIRKEYYASDIRKTYSLAKKSLDKVSGDVLGGKILKTLALVRIVQQYRLVEPTRQMLLDVYGDCGFDSLDIEEAIARLVETESVIYQRESNGYLRLKESSGVDVEQAISDRASMLADNMSPVEILNSSQLINALYPSRYNEEHDIVRYFDCGFIPVSELMTNPEKMAVRIDGDGAVIAAYASNPDEMTSIENAARMYTKIHPLCIVSIPREYDDVVRTLFRFEAAKELRFESQDDAILSEEYGMVADDCGEMISIFIEKFFRPELRSSRYFAAGKEIKGVTRRRKLSDALSELCDIAFPYTPRITHETLNKNVLTGAGLSSRSKLLIALCATLSEPKLGLVGSGQEVAMARSALLKTGVIQNFDAPKVELHPKDENVNRMMELIEKFVSHASGNTFEELYDMLTGQKYKIGMKRGPIPLFLALVLKEHRNEITIAHDGEEKTLDATLIRDIDLDPRHYSISRIDWSPEKALYIKALAELFGCSEEDSRAKVADAMRMWYVALPQLTRNAIIDHTRSGGVDFGAHTAFFNVLKKADMDSSCLLFTELPKIFGAKIAESKLLERIKSEKIFAESFIELTTERLAADLKETIDPKAHEDASLASVVGDWMNSLSAESKSYVYSGLTSRALVAFNSVTNDDSASAQRIAKAITTLRIEDWKDARFGDFLNAIRATIEEVESVGAKASKDCSNECQLSIKFYDGDSEQVRTFKAAEYTNFARMLKRNLDSCLDDMGESVSLDQKRQVVFDVLRSLC